MLQVIPDSPEVILELYWKTEIGIISSFYKFDALNSKEFFEPSFLFIILALVANHVRKAG